MKKTDWEYTCEIVRGWLSETPKTQAELEALTGIDRRTIRLAVHDLRAKGYKICSGNRGFWMWDGKDDSWQKTKTTIIRKGASSLRLIYMIAKAEKEEGQITFDDLLGEVSA